MNFAQLKAFQAVANNGSITGAAQLLHVSQPSVSKHLKNLEEDYGVKLFERNAGAAELTDAGSSLLRHADAILVHLDEARKELKSPKSLKISPGAMPHQRLCFLRCWSILRTSTATVPSYCEPARPEK